MTLPNPRARLSPNKARKMRSPRVGLGDLGRESTSSFHDFTSVATKLSRIFPISTCWRPCISTSKLFLDSKPRRLLSLRALFLFYFGFGYRMATLWGTLNYWNSNPISGEQKLQKLKESKPEPIETCISDNTALGLLSEAKRYLLLGDGINDDGDPSASLPPQVIINVCLNQAFQVSYEACNFSQSLTALDYIQNLERSRRLALRKTAKKLGLHAMNFHHVVETSPTIRYYVMAVDQHSPVVDQSYAACYLDLRAWCIFNLLTHDTIWKQEAIAMINTLFPPDMTIPPCPGISIAKINHYRRTLYDILLAVKEDPTIIFRVIERANNPDPDSPKQSRFKSWKDTRDALDCYLNYSIKMIQEAEQVQEQVQEVAHKPARDQVEELIQKQLEELVENQVAYEVSPSKDEPSEAFNLSNGTKTTRNGVDDTTEMGNFLTLQDRDVGQKHLMFLADYSKRLQDQEKRQEELQRKVELQEQELAEMKRTHTIRKKVNSSLTKPQIAEAETKENNSSLPKTRQDVHNESQLGRNPQLLLTGSPNVASDTSSMTSPTLKSRIGREPPPVEGHKYPGGYIGTMPGAQTRTSVDDNGRRSCQFEQPPVYLIRSQEAPEQIQSRFIRPFQSPEINGNASQSGFAVVPRSKLFNVRTPDPVVGGSSFSTISAGEYVRNDVFGSTPDQTSTRHTPHTEPIGTLAPITDQNRLQRSNTTARNHGYRNTLPDTPEVVTPPTDSGSSKRLTAAAFLQQYEPGNTTSVLGSDSTSPTDTPELIETSRKSVQGEDKKKFRLFGRKKQKQRINKTNPEGLGIELNHQKNPFKTSLLRKSAEAARDISHGIDGDFLKKNSSSTSIFRAEKTTDPKADLHADLKPPSAPFAIPRRSASTLHSSVSSYSSLTGDHSDRDGTKKKTPRIRSRVSGRILNPGEMDGQLVTAFAVSRQHITTSYQSIAASPKSLAASPQDVNTSLNDSNHESRDVNDSGSCPSRNSRTDRRIDSYQRPSSAMSRPSSAMSGESRGLNKLRKARSFNSDNTGASDRTKATTPARTITQTPKTPTNTEKRKQFWHSVITPKSNKSNVISGNNHSPPPNVQLPPGFHLPSLLDNESSPQSSSVEDIRVRVIGDAYKRHGLDRDISAKNDEEKRKGSSNVRSTSDEGDILGVPISNKKRKSPMKKIEQLIEATIMGGYSPKKPELATWHLTDPTSENNVGGSLNLLSPEVQIVREGQSINSGQQVLSSDPVPRSKKTATEITVDTSTIDLQSGEKLPVPM